MGGGVRFLGGVFGREVFFGEGGEEGRGERRREKRWRVFFFLRVVQRFVGLVFFCGVEGLGELEGFVFLKGKTLTFWKVQGMGPKMAKVHCGVLPDILKITQDVRRHCTEDASECPH